MLQSVGLQRVRQDCVTELTRDAMLRMEREKQAEKREELKETELHRKPLGQLQLFSHQKRSLGEPSQGVWVLLQKPLVSKEDELIFLCGLKYRIGIDSEWNRGRL